MAAAATPSTRSHVISGCYERFVLGHEACEAPRGGDASGNGTEGGQQEGGESTLAWTQRFAVKAHQGPVKCVQVSSGPVGLVRAAATRTSARIRDWRRARTARIPHRTDAFSLFSTGRFCSRKEGS